MNNNIIVSLTSYKPRLKYVKQVIDSILNNTIKPYKICLTLYKDDIQYIPQDLQEYIDNNIIELIICDLDIKCHKKYFYIMQKYRENPILTIDDDCIYSEDLIESFLNIYIKYPNYVLARRVYKKTYNNGELNPYKYWQIECKHIIYPSLELFANGVGGILYPPNILNISYSNLKEIEKCLYNDDVYLHYLELKNKIQILYIPNNMNHPKTIKDSQECGLWLTKNNCYKENNECDKTINLFLKNINI